MEPSELDRTTSKSCQQQWSRPLTDYGAWAFPCFELIRGGYSTEPWEPLVELWRSVGGRVFEGHRIIAPRSSALWTAFGLKFPGGTGMPFPPYRWGSCLTWRNVDEAEVRRLGAMTDDDLKNRPRELTAGERDLARVVMRMSPEDRRQLKEELEQFLGQRSPR